MGSNYVQGNLIVGLGRDYLLIALIASSYGGLARFSEIGLRMKAPHLSDRYHLENPITKRVICRPQDFSSIFSSSARTPTNSYEYIGN